MVKFYIVIATEAIFWPFLYAFEAFRVFLGRFVSQDKINIRSEEKIALDSEVIFAVHEWAKYPFVREKKIKYVNKIFKCGIKFHFDRLGSYKGKYKLKKILTISDCSEKYLNELKHTDFFLKDTIIREVENSAMDFSGYDHVVKNFISQGTEQIIFLTNTSVSDHQIQVIDEYVELFEKDPSLGLLGVSYSTKVYQTLIKNNFLPHLQSFFLVSKSSVINKLLDLNGGSLPGANETYKLSIIRFGEVKLTQLILKLGYKAAVIDEVGNLNYLPVSGIFYNGYSKWTLPHGDYRLHSNRPNSLSRLKPTYEA